MPTVTVVIGRRNEIACAGGGLIGRLACLAALAWLGSTSVHAQDSDIQQMAARSRPAPSTVETVRFMHDFGVCAAGDVPNYARQVLGQIPASASADKALFWVATLSNSCVKQSDKLRFSPRYLRGPLAESFIVRDFDLPGWKIKKTALPLYQQPSATKLEKLDAVSKSWIVMVDVGSCIARAAPGETAALITSAITTDAEAKAFSALGSAIGGCLPPRFELKMSKFQLRSFIAEGAYRAMASTSGGGS